MEATYRRIPELVRNIIARDFHKELCLPEDYVFVRPCFRNCPAVPLPQSRVAYLKGMYGGQIQPSVRLASIQSVHVSTVSGPYYFVCREAYTPGCECHGENARRVFRKRENLVLAFRDPARNVTSDKEPRSKVSLRKKYVCPKCDSECVRVPVDDSYIQCRHVTGIARIYRERAAELDLWAVEDEDLQPILPGDCIDVMGACYALIEYRSVGQRAVGIPFSQMLILDFAKNYSRSANISPVLTALENYKLKLPLVPGPAKQNKHPQTVPEPKQVVRDFDVALWLVDSLYKRCVPTRTLLLSKLALTLGAVSCIVRDVANFTWDRQRASQTEAEARMKSLSSYCLTQFPCETNRQAGPTEGEETGCRFLFSVNILLLGSDPYFLLRLAECVGKSLSGFVRLDDIPDLSVIRRQIAAGMCNVVFVRNFLALNVKQIEFLEQIMHSASAVSVWTVCDKSEFDKLFPLALATHRVCHSHRRKDLMEFQLLSRFDIVLDTTRELSPTLPESIDSVFASIVSQAKGVDFGKYRMKFGGTSPAVQEESDLGTAEYMLQAYFLSRRSARPTTQFQLSAMAKLAYAFHFLRKFCMRPPTVLGQSLSLLDPHMWDPVDFVVAALLFEETCFNRAGPSACLIDRFVLHNSTQP